MCTLRKTFPWGMSRLKTCSLFWWTFLVVSIYCQNQWIYLGQEFIIDPEYNEMKITKAPGGQTPTGNSSGSPFVWGLCSSQTQSPPSPKAQCPKAGQREECPNRVPAPYHGPSRWLLSVPVLNSSMASRLFHFTERETEEIAVFPW